MHLFDRIQNKLEIFRLESRYTKNRNRRSTFVSDAIYVDGEYVYASSNNTGSSTNSRSTVNTTSTNSTSGSTNRSRSAQPYAAQNRHKGNNVSDFGAVERPEMAVRSESEPYRSQSYHKGTGTREEDGMGEEAYRQQALEKKKRLSRRWSQNWGSTVKRDGAAERRMSSVPEDRW